VSIVVLFYNSSSSTNYSTNRGHPDGPVGGNLVRIQGRANQIVT